jgi:hypothetical protein
LTKYGRRRQKRKSSWHRTRTIASEIQLMYCGRPSTRV